MRSIIAAATLAVLMLALGCNIAPHRRDNPPSAPAPVADNAMPMAENLVRYLNANAQRIREGEAISCANVPIDVHADGQRVGVNGKLMCQAPRNFRLTAVLLGNPAVDIGSNKDEFWYWISKNQPPYLFHCSYEALARGVSIPFPFQPDMAVTALGLSKYDETKRYEVRRGDNKKGPPTIELIEQTVSAQNQPIQKITVFNAQAARTPDQPQVIAHVLKDAQGNILCVANIRRAQYVGSNGAIIPREVVFNWPSQKLQMTMHIENPQVVSLTEDRAGTVFSRRQLGYQSYDLAVRALDGAGLQRAGATAPVYPR
jgi:hypothetical protein